MPKPEAVDSTNSVTFWKISGAGAAFQAGSTAVDSATIVASLVHHLTGNVYAVGAASAVLRLGWLIPQLIVGYLAQRSERRMPFYIFGAFGRAGCLGIIAIVLWLADHATTAATAIGFMVLWTAYAFISGVVAVPYNDIVGRSIPSGARSRMLAWRFFGGGILAVFVASAAHQALKILPILSAYALIFAAASILMLISSMLFVWAGEPAVKSATPKPFNLQGEKPRPVLEFLQGGLEVLRHDGRFRLFLYFQWLGGASLMALPFYVVAVSSLGLKITDIAVLLAAQTGGALASNPLWGKIGDGYGKLRLLQAVGMVRVLVPLTMVLIFATVSEAGSNLILFALLFAFIGALINGTTIGYLGYLMEISPDDRRPVYSAYFNALASPAALLPLVGAVIVEAVSIQAVFVAAALAAVFQLYLLLRISQFEVHPAE